MRIIGLNIPVFYAAVVRNIVGFLILLFFVVRSKKWKHIKNKDLVWLMIRTAGGIIGFSASVIAVLHIPISTYIFVFYVGTLITGYLIGLLQHNEKLTFIKIISFVLAMVGLAYIYTISLDITKIFYFFLSFGSGVGNGVWSAGSKKVSGNYSTLQLNFIDYVFTIIGCVLLSFLFKEQWTIPQVNSAWFANAGFVIIFLITGQLMIYGYKFIEAQKAALIMLSEILFAIVLAYLFFHETMTTHTIIGGICIIIAIALPDLLSIYSSKYHEK